MHLLWRKLHGQTQRVEVGLEAHKPDAHKTLSANLPSVLPLLPDLHQQSLPQLAVCKDVRLCKLRRLWYCVSELIDIRWPLADNKVASRELHKVGLRRHGRYTYWPHFILNHTVLPMHLKWTRKLHGQKNPLTVRRYETQWTLKYVGHIEQQEHLSTRNKFLDVKSDRYFYFILFSIFYNFSNTIIKLHSTSRT